MRHPDTDAALHDRQNLVHIFNAALTAVDPRNAVFRALRVEQDQLHVAGTTYDLHSFECIIVVGAGKATARMAFALEKLLGNRIAAGLIVVKEGHTAPLSIIEQVEAAHPVPDESGIAATQRILRMARAANEKTLVICLLSGGASALLVAPAEGVTLQDKQNTTRLLLHAGASISELNAVRKHLSAVKGGHLAQAAFPAQLLTLIVSDVIGDPLDVIASGPTSPDCSTFADALAVIEKFRLQEILPLGVSDHLQRGKSGQVPETLKPHDPSLNSTHNVIVASVRQALDAAQEKAAQLGFGTKTITRQLQGEARDAARWLGKIVRAELTGMKPEERCCLLCGGETTVTVRGSGSGGRNQEFALAFALEFEDSTINTGKGLRVTLLSAGTDGTDGPNDAAGAIVDDKTAARARALGINPRKYLDNNDSYAFFHDLDIAAGIGSHFKTGPTGTNVMDIQIVLLHTGTRPDKLTSPLR